MGKEKMSYGNFINGKSVIFVGACPNLLGKHMREFIHSYDVIVRTNNAFPVNKLYQRDYGSRCDVLYINRQFYREMRPLNYDVYSKMKLKWICAKGIRRKDINRAPDSLGIRTLEKIIEKILPVNPTASMGSIIFTDILNFNPRELFITGIDFFASRKPKFEYDVYGEYLPDYLPPKIRAQGNKINMGKIEDSHNFLENAKYVHGLFNSYKNILKTDDYTRKLLSDILDGKVKQGDIKYD